MQAQIRLTSNNIYWGDFCLLHLLKRLGIDFIEGELTGKPFRVEVEVWIQRGIKSPFTSGSVDPQTILKLSYIFPDDPNTSQLSLFGRA